MTTSIFSVRIAYILIELRGVYMIRIVLGLLLLMGAIGSQDYAVEAGIMGPPLIETALYSILGIALMGWGVVSINLKEGS